MLTECIRLKILNSTYVHSLYSTESILGKAKIFSFCLVYNCTTVQCKKRLNNKSNCFVLSCSRNTRKEKPLQSIVKLGENRKQWHAIKRLTAYCIFNRLSSKELQEPQWVKDKNGNATSRNMSSLCFFTFMSSSELIFAKIWRNKIPLGVLMEFWRKI